MKDQLRHLLQKIKYSEISGIEPEAIKQNELLNNLHARNKQFSGFNLQLLEVKNDQ